MEDITDTLLAPFRALATRLAEGMKKRTGLNIWPVETIEEAANADIVVTCTPVREPLVKSEWIKPGTHINAIGADAPGKEKLEPELLRRAKIMVDNIEQASHSGEINVPWSKGIIKWPEAVSCTLGEVIAGLKKGRETDEEITIFDSTGLAIQDIATARLVFEKAQKSKEFLPTEWSS